MTEERQRGLGSVAAVGPDLPEPYRRDREEAVDEALARRFERGDLLGGQRRFPAQLRQRAVELSTPDRLSPGADPLDRPLYVRATVCPLGGPVCD